MRRRDLFLSAASAGVCLLGGPIWAGHGFVPQMPVKLMVPNPPGGAMDIIARALTQALGARWSPQTVVLDYKPGAGTMLGNEWLAHAKPDGHVLGMVATPMVIQPTLQKLRFDPEKDLAPLGRLGTADLLFACAPGLPVADLNQAIALVRAHPGRYTCASAGVGSAMHLALELLKQRAALDLVHVPFNGAGPAFVELAAGRVDFMIEPVFSCLPHVQQGRMRPLATTGHKPSTQIPGIPPLVSVIPGMLVQSFFGLAAPGATPPAVLDALQEDLQWAVQSPEFQQRLQSVGMDAAYLDRVEFARFVTKEIRRWRGLVQELGLSSA